MVANVTIYKSPIDPAARNLLCATLIIVLLALLIGALSIPYVFESPSMFYKFGWKKMMLRSGKMVGLTAALLLLLQLPLAARLKVLDRLYALPVLYTVHRFSAHGIIALVLIHPVLIFAPDGILMIPFEIRYWPEWVGAALLIAISLQFGLAKWRYKVIKAYEKWLLIHRILGVASIALMIIHILYVSETFEHKGIARNTAVISASAYLSLLIWVRIQERTIRRKPLKIKKVYSSGETATAIDLEPFNTSPLRFVPGQFAFISFRANQISKEPHPFTISSAPSRPDSLQFTVRRCGDWTKKINTLQQGDKAFIQGPFGRFGHLFVSGNHNMIMIAGGIGITPMLSMLRYMSDVEDPRQIILIWSNQTPRHIFNEDELTKMEKKLTGLQWIPIFTRERGDRGLFGRLDRKKLESLLRTFDRNAQVFLCGPPQMIMSVRSDLNKIGFPKRSIRYEAFGF